jgi:hypothetical protein
MPIPETLMRVTKGRDVLDRPIKSGDDIGAWGEMTRNILRLAL